MLPLSKRHYHFFWLSWKWGLYLAMLIGLGLVLVSFLYPSSKGLCVTVRASPETFLALILLDSVGALLGNLLRQRLMGQLLRRAEAAPTRAARLGWLAGGTFLLFVVSVLFCAAAFMVFTFDIRIITMLVPLLRLFFLLSFPWLLTAPLAACWICRDWLIGLPASGIEVSK